MAEAVGIVLAVAPLVISAIEDYERTVKAFRAFKGFSQKIKVNLKSLNIQQVIFRKANERLLRDCVDEDHARQMLADRNHSSWHDQQVAGLYLERLGGSRSAFEDSIELISNELSVIRSALNQFTVPQGGSLRMLKKRVRYAFKESDLESALATLKERNRDLVTLLELSTPYQLRMDKPTYDLAARKELNRFYRVQETAKDLYQALRHACTKHTDHQAHLSLQPVFYETTQVRFTIAFSQQSLTCSSDKDGRSSASTWLIVESSITGRIQSAVDDGSLLHTQCSLKRAFNSDQAPEKVQAKPKTVKKCIRFQTPASNTLVGVRVPKLTVPPLINLCINNNFCDQLQKFINQSQPSNAAIGFLDLSGESKHLLYIDSKSQIVMRSQSSSNLRSLQEALKKAKAGTSFTLAQKISLARQLARAVIQFHTTPWMKNTLDSSEVLFSVNEVEKEAGENEHPDTEAFITTHINGPHSPPVRAQTLPSPIVVRNQLLFSLGVIFLELAFQKPLNELTIERDKDRVHSRDTEYLTADRLGRQVSAHMGPRYAEAARKCIHCDFGCGFDLKKSNLQEGFYRGVVCELEKLEDQMKRL